MQHLKLEPRFLAGACSPLKRVSKSTEYPLDTEAWGAGSTCSIKCRKQAASPRHAQSTQPAPPSKLSPSKHSQRPPIMYLQLHTVFSDPYSTSTGPQPLSLNSNTEARKALTSASKHKGRTESRKNARYTRTICIHGLDSPLQ